MLHAIALWLVALLFGGMVLYASGFAAVLFTSLPPDLAGATLRRAFPHFYLFVTATAAAAVPLVGLRDRPAALALAAIALTAIPARQLLMPAINRATDQGDRQRFKWLHGLSVAVTLAHIATAAAVLARFA